MGQEIKLVNRFDGDKNGYLDLKERTEARKAIQEERGNRGGMRGPGGGRGPMMTPGSPGAKVDPAGVKTYPSAHLYDPGVLRTLFLQFENQDWEAELADFNNTDVDVPATLIVDGKEYKNVGVHFRGASSFMMVPAGNKRSLNLAMDLVDDKQRLYGFKTLNLLNSNGDPSFMSTVLYSQIARNYIPAPRANYAKVVINGESWGVYINVEQFNHDFVTEHFKEAQVKDKTGARWKVSGSPQGNAGLNYSGPEPAAYKQRYDLKSKENEEDWKALINLCKVLSETPIEDLAEAVKPILDVEGALWFLALDLGLMNSDGYWIRASDYSIYRDPKGVFHLIPHDMNEAFRAEGGPGGRGPRGGGPGGPPPLGQPGFGGPPPEQRGTGFTLDPFHGSEDMRKPLRSRLLAVPAFRTKYLANLRALATKWLDWAVMGPMVDKNRSVIETELKNDTRKNSSFEAFLGSVNGQNQSGRSLKAFADGRRKFLLEYKEVK